MLCGAKTAQSYRKLDFDRKICYNYLVKTREEQEEKNNFKELQKQEAYETRSQTFKKKSFKKTR